MLHLTGLSITNSAISGTMYSGFGAGTGFAQPGSVSAKDLTIASRAITGKHNGIQFNSAGAGNSLIVDGLTITGNTISSQNAHGVSIANYSAGVTTVQGTLNSTPGRRYAIELFANDAADPSGYGEGQTFVGTTTVDTGPDGNGAFALTVSPAVDTGKFIAATATDQSTGDTSEFSANRMVVGPPSDPALSPTDASALVDAAQCVTALSTGTLGHPTSGVTIRFLVSGLNRIVGSAATDNGGLARFCYASALAGSDSIHAYADTNGNDAQEDSEPDDRASATWAAPSSSAACKVTYGGAIIASNGDRATFGGNAQGAGKGELQFTDHGPAQPLNVHSGSILSVIYMEGTATVWGEADTGFGGILFIDLVDAGEPGRTDSFRLRLGNGYDSRQSKLEGGNVQVR